MSAGTTSEVRLPADPSYIVVAKRAAAGFACVAGFDVEAVDDLVIAVAQACENARAGKAAPDDLRGSTFTITNLGIFDIDAFTPIINLPECAILGVGRILARPVVTDEESGEVAAAEPASRAAVQMRDQAMRDALLAHDLALRVIGLFVDDCRYRVDERTGGLRVRLTKYRMS